MLATPYQMKVCSFLSAPGSSMSRQTFEFLVSSVLTLNFFFFFFFSNSWTRWRPESDESQVLHPRRVSCKCISVCLKWAEVNQCPATNTLVLLIHNLVFYTRTCNPSWACYVALNPMNLFWWCRPPRGDKLSADAQRWFQQVLLLLRVLPLIAKHIL